MIGNLIKVASSLRGATGIIHVCDSDGDSIARGVVTGSGGRNASTQEISQKARRMVGLSESQMQELIANGELVADIDSNTTVEISIAPGSVKGAQGWNQ